MTTDTKPTKKQVDMLQDQLDKNGKIITIMVSYHNKRTTFFKLWNFSLNILNAFVGVLALSAIGWQLAVQADRISSITNSLLAASVTVLLLFFTMLFDFSKKEETHRLLAIIYADYNKEISDINLITWDNLSAEDYIKYKDLYARIKEGMSSLKKLEFPMLDLEFFLCNLAENITEKADQSIFISINWWYRFWASYFSMPNARTRFIVKYNDRKK